MSKLASLDKMKELMEWSGSEQDTLATNLLVRASAFAELLARRPLMRQADITEYPSDPNHYTRFLQLRVYPIESVTSVKQLYDVGADSDFTAADSLTENVDYLITARSGQLERVHQFWSARRRWVQVIYTGGYYDPSGNAPSNDAIAPPEDLQHGVLQQAVRMYQTKDTAGLREIELGQGGGVSLAEAKPHPALEAVCKRLESYGL